jgi:hypothetical protein
VLRLATSINIPKAARGADSKRKAVDEIVVLKREVMFVLDRRDLGLIYDLLRVIVVRYYCKFSKDNLATWRS